MEPVRAAQELVGRFAASPSLRKAPKGDGHPVLVLPGFTGSDISTRVMRVFLRRLGYYVHAWRLGRNWGPTDYILDGLGERFGTLYQEHHQKMTLIGHSLGGVYSRELARRAPQLVRQVVTLGSPVRMRAGETSNVAPLYKAVRSRHSERVRDVNREQFEDVAIGVPLTVIFTRTDGVVGWRNCVVEPGPRRECIEVQGSHTGLIHNAAVMHVVADRLAQPEGEWKPFVERDGVAARIWTPD